MPYASPARDATLRFVDMYTHLLTMALGNSSDDDVVGVDLLTAARTSRARLPAREHGSGVTACDHLAAEVRYDRSLVRLASTVGITTSASRFSPASAERQRLEQELAARGIVLRPTDSVP